MAEVISIIEHQVLPVVDDREIGDFSLSKKHAQQLSRLSSLPDGAFTWGHNSIKWSQFCGIVQLSDLTLEILPKIHGKEDNPGACRNTLIRMLRRAGLLKLYKPGNASVSLQKHTLLDVFIQDLCQQLDTQLAQGMVRQYISLEENLPLLRGKLLANQQFRHNLAHKERLYCQYDELSADILLNRIIKFTLKLLLPKARSQTIKKNLIRQIHELDAVSDQSIDVQLVKSLILNRAEKRYENIFTACLLFIRGLAPDIHSGSQKAFSLLFDMNQLFEAWCATILKPIAIGLDMQVVEQKPRRYMAYRLDIDREVFQMKPDISFMKENRAVVIADAKWKLLAADEAKLGISQADLYQMQAYANRYGVKKLILIYPKQTGLEDVYCLQLHGANKVEIVIVALEIDGIKGSNMVDYIPELLKVEEQMASPSVF